MADPVGAVVAGTAEVISNIFGGLADLEKQFFKVADAQKAMSGAVSGGIRELAKADIKLRAFAEALGVVPIVGARFKEDMEAASLAIRNLKNITADEVKILDGLSNMLKGKHGEALKNFSDRLATTARDIQTYQVSLLKLGQDVDQVVHSTRNLTVAFSVFGISNKEIRESIEATVKGLNGSIRITEEGTIAFEKQRYELSILAAFNKKFGIEYTETTKLANLFNDAMGGGVGTIQKFSDSLEKFALETGQDVNETFKLFTANMDRFSGLSTERALESFTRLQAYAKRTGQEFSSIRTNLEGFDDISTGYEKIGKLNRLLMQFGSSIDPMAFMQATDEEKQKMMVEAIAKVQNYGGMGTEQGKRLLFKAFAEASGQSVQAIQGFIGGRGEGFTEDSLAALERKPAYVQFTTQERKELSKSLTDSEQQGKVRDGLMFATDSAQKLAAKMRADDEQKTRDMLGIYNKLDKNIFKDIVEGNFSKILEASSEQTKEIIKAIGVFLGAPGSDISTAAKNLDAAASKIVGAALGPPGELNVSPISSTNPDVFRLLQEQKKPKRKKVLRTPISN